MLFFNKNYHKKGFAMIGQIATMYKGQDYVNNVVGKTGFMAFSPHKKIILLVANQEFNYTLGGRLIIKN